jgi:hypothetical protein
VHLLRPLTLVNEADELFSVEPRVISLEDNNQLVNQILKSAGTYEVPKVLIICLPNCQRDTDVVLFGHLYHLLSQTLARLLLPPSNGEEKP